MSRPSPAIEILRWRPIQKNGLLATFSVAARGTVIHSCRVFLKEKKWYVGAPQREYVANGERRFESIVDFSEAFLKAIVDAVSPLVDELARGERR